MDTIKLLLVYLIIYILKNLYGYKKNYFIKKTKY